MNSMQNQNQELRAALDASRTSSTGAGNYGITAGKFHTRAFESASDGDEATSGAADGRGKFK